ncbi:MAG: DNA repair protein RecO [Bacteroidetes bacterium]|nr:DNA repair protein RecO [Bacteroidota bacterium]
MIFSDKALVLQVIKYSDKKSIIKCFTKKNGLLSFIVARSKKNNTYNAVVQPLHFIDIVYSKKSANSILFLNEANCYYNYKSVSTNLFKLCIFQFINELFIKSLKEHVVNEELFDHIFQSIKNFDESTNSFENTHLVLMIDLTIFLGFEPLNNFSDNNCFFNLKEGSFINVEFPFPLGLNGSESIIFSEFLKTKQATNKQQRNLIVKILTGYFAEHIPNFNYLKSIEVLQDVLN